MAKDIEGDYQPKPAKSYSGQVKIENWTGGKSLLAHFDPDGRLTGVISLRTGSQIDKWVDQNISDVKPPVVNGIYQYDERGRPHASEVGSLHIFDGRGGHQGIVHMKRALTDEERSRFDTPSKGHMDIIGHLDYAFNRLQSKTDHRKWDRDKKKEKLALITQKANPYV